MNPLYLFLTFAISLILTLAIPLISIFTWIITLVSGIILIYLYLPIHSHTLKALSSIAILLVALSILHMIGFVRGGFALAILGGYGSTCRVIGSFGGIPVEYCYSAYSTPSNSPPYPQPTYTSTSSTSTSTSSTSSISYPSSSPVLFPSGAIQTLIIQPLSQVLSFLYI